MALVVDPLEEWMFSVCRREKRRDFLFQCFFLTQLGSFSRVLIEYACNQIKARDLNRMSKSKFNIEREETRILNGYESRNAKNKQMTCIPEVFENIFNIL